MDLLVFIKLYAPKLGIPIGKFTYIQSLKLVQVSAPMFGVTVYMKLLITEMMLMN